jgi:hypothetical protein
MGIAPTNGRHTRDKGVLGLVDENGQGRGEERHVDPLAEIVGRAPLALATGEGRKDSHRALEAGCNISDRHPDLRRSTAVLVRLAGD